MTMRVRKTEQLAGRKNYFSEFSDDFSMPPLMFFAAFKIYIVY